MHATWLRAGILARSKEKIEVSRREQRERGREGERGRMGERRRRRETEIEMPVVKKKKTGEREA